ncbi:MAG TPA: peptidoglycan-binding domain-containing protein [Candidatus Binatia bacterium]|nr:peptidoglycan-binding domain-containing protein [Candidatus Binatia bacterium]
MRKELTVVSVLIFAGFLATGYGWAQTKSGSDAATSSDSSKSTSKMKSDKSSTSSSDMGSSGSSMDMSKSASGGSENVKKVQEALKEKGQDPGPIDGRMGAKTKAALKSYQSANNLKPTGRLDSETAKSLGVSSAAGGSAEKGMSKSSKGSSGSSEKKSSSDTGASTK